MTPSDPLTDEQRELAKLLAKAVKLYAKGMRDERQFKEAQAVGNVSLALEAIARGSSVEDAFKI